jgi:hypothetical protein
MPSSKDARRRHDGRLQRLVDVFAPPAGTAGSLVLGPGEGGPAKVGGRFGYGEATCLAHVDATPQQRVFFGWIAIPASRQRVHYIPGHTACQPLVFRIGAHQPVVRRKAVLSASRRWRSERTSRRRLLSRLLGVNRAGDWVGWPASSATSCAGRQPKISCRNNGQ